jgi:hypothetical protein
MLLTKIPIVIYYGDSIPDKPSVNPGQEQWRIFLGMARRWRDVVNRHGGDVTLVRLPEISGSRATRISDVGLEQRPDCGSVVEVSVRKRSWTNPLLNHRGASASELQWMVSPSRALESDLLSCGLDT